MMTALDRLDLYLKALRDAVRAAGAELDLAEAWIRDRHAAFEPRDQTQSKVQPTEQEWWVPAHERPEWFEELQWAFVRAGLCAWDPIMKPHPQSFALVAMHFFAERAVIASSASESTERAHVPPKHGLNCTTIDGECRSMHCPTCGEIWHAGGPCPAVTDAASEDDEPLLASEVEALSAELHAIYQAEARRQAQRGEDEVRHPDDYDALPEHTKEYDRVLARYILLREATLRAELSADSAETPDALREEVERLLDAIADLGIDTVNGPWPNDEMGDCGRAASAVRTILQAGDKAEAVGDAQR